MSIDTTAHTRTYTHTHTHTHVHTHIHTHAHTHTHTHAHTLVPPPTQCYIIEDDTAKGLKEKLNTLEADLSEARNKLALGYTDPKVYSYFLL
jgi:hypothetical protein